MLIVYPEPCEALGTPSREPDRTVSPLRDLREDRVPKGRGSMLQFLKILPLLAP